MPYKYLSCKYSVMSEVLNCENFISGWHYDSFWKSAYNLLFGHILLIKCQKLSGKKLVGLYLKVGCVSNLMGDRDSHCLENPGRQSPCISTLQAICSKSTSMIDLQHINPNKTHLIYCSVHRLVQLCTSYLRHAQTYLSHTTLKIHVGDIKV